mmetsp:Transcript_36073/g.71786  ORF Transcript_36073/g.71786 Transcript_36073/m.71786 type:complete len:317 (+) Transcript_36073:143-1093(+)
MPLEKPCWTTGRCWHARPGKIAAAWKTLAHDQVGDYRGALVGAERARIRRQRRIWMHLRIANALHHGVCGVEMVRHRRRGETRRQGEGLDSAARLPLRQSHRMLDVQELRNSVCGCLRCVGACPRVDGDIFRLDDGRRQEGPILEACRRPTCCFASVLVRPAGDVDDARPRRGAERRKQQVGEQEVSQVVDLENQFEPVIRLFAGPSDACVVDEDVQPRTDLLQVGARKRSHRRQGAQVEQHGLHLRVASQPSDGRRGEFAVGGVPVRDDYAGIPCRQSVCGSKAEAVVAAGHHHHHAAQVPASQNISSCCAAGAF